MEWGTVDRTDCAMTRDGSSRLLDSYSNASKIRQSPAIALAAEPVSHADGSLKQAGQLLGTMR